MSEGMIVFGLVGWALAAVSMYVQYRVVRLLVRRSEVAIDMSAQGAPRPVCIGPEKRISASQLADLREVAEDETRPLAVLARVDLAALVAEVDRWRGQAEPPPWDGDVFEAARAAIPPEVAYPDGSTDPEPLA